MHFKPVYSEFKKENSFFFPSFSNSGVNPAINEGQWNNMKTQNKKLFCLFGNRENRGKRGEKSELFNISTLNLKNQTYPLKISYYIIKLCNKHHRLHGRKNYNYSSLYEQSTLLFSQLQWP